MEILKTAVRFLEKGESVVLVTVLEASRGTPGKAGFKMVVAASGELHGTVGGGALEKQAVEEARQLLQRREGALREYNLSELGMKCGGRATLLFEHLQGARSFLLFGGGHLGRALAPILESLGFRITVYDSRPEVRDLLGQSAGRRVVIGSYEDLSALGPLDTEFAFIATHGHEHDYTVLRQLLQAGVPFRYIGLIGSRTKVRSTLQRLRSQGLEPPEALYAPVGLAVGGDTPAEIAVSIAAEVVAVMNGAAAVHMRDRLHENAGT